MEQTTYYVIHQDTSGEYDIAEVKADNAMDALHEVGAYDDTLEVFAAVTGDNVTVFAPDTGDVLKPTEGDAVEETEEEGQLPADVEAAEGEEHENQRGDEA